MREQRGGGDEEQWEDGEAGQGGKKREKSTGAVALLFDAMGLHPDPAAVQRAQLVLDEVVEEAVSARVRELEERMAARRAVEQRDLAERVAQVVAERVVETVEKSVQDAVAARLAQQEARRELAKREPERVARIRKGAIEIVTGKWTSAAEDVMPDPVCDAWWFIEGLQVHERCDYILSLCEEIGVIAQPVYRSPDIQTNMPWIELF